MTVLACVAFPSVSSSSIQCLFGSGFPKHCILRVLKVREPPRGAGPSVAKGALATPPLQDLGINLGLLEDDLGVILHNIETILGVI